MRQLKVYRDGDTGAPTVLCPSCEEFVEPDRSPLLHSYDCGCGAVLDADSMKAYEKARHAWLDDDEEGDPLG